MMYELHQGDNQAKGSLESNPPLRKLSYDHIARMAAGLQRLDASAMHPEDLVVIQADLSLPTCSLILAFVEAGIPLLVLSEQLSEYKREQVKLLMQTKRVALWINGPSSLKHELGDPLLITSSEDVFDSLQHAPEEIPIRSASPSPSPSLTPSLSRSPSSRSADQPALILATSGTTGAPKWVPFSYRQLEAATRASQPIMQPKSGHQWLLNLPLEHAGGLGILIRSYFWRSDLLIASDRSAEGILDLLERHPNVDTLSLVPTQLHRMLQHPKREVLARLKNILIGAGTLHQNDLNLAKSLRIPVRMSYGMTETFGHCCITPCLTQQELEPFQCGSPLPGIQISIEDDQGVALPSGEIGHIRVKGDSIFKGYLQLASTQINEEGFLTGDYGKLDKQGTLFFEARRTDLIKTGGKSVNVNRVQAALQHTDWFTEVVVLGLEDAEWGQRIHAVGVAKNKELTLETLRRGLQTLLEPWELPRGLTLLPNIPRTPLGKTDISALKQLLRSNPDA